MQLTKYEITRILSARSDQLAWGAPPLVKTNYNSTPYSIAKEEYDKKVIPLAVIRVTKDGNKEIISIK
jgi:DNA-directed RNA polymerase subunit K/omega